jgi:signal transduction histidine kinase
MGALAVLVAFMFLGGDLIPEHMRLENFASWIVFVLVAGLALAFLIYTFEKELSLRRLAAALMEERVRSVALTGRLNETAALLEIGEALNATLDLGDVFRLILSSAKELIGGDECSIMLLDEKGDLEVVSYHGRRGAAAMHRRLRIGEGMEGRVAAERIPLLVQSEDVQSLARRSNGHGHAAQIGYVSSSICVPLIRRGELLGVLSLNETEPGSLFNAQDLGALELFAQQAAVAIGNASRFEDERDAVARLEELDRLKSDFVATVSHELKTPLTAIIGAAKTVTSKRHRMKPEQHDQFMEMIERQGTRLLRLVEDVLTAARIESGLPRLKRERVDVRALADGVIEDLSHSSMGEDRDIVLFTDPEHPEAWGDRTSLQHVLGNLVENALKYSAAGTKVTILLIESAAETVIEVADEGDGISPEQLQTIFDRFRRADSTPTSRVGGFGLGLYIVKNLVERHRGEVEVESEIGKGSTFRVRLPKRVIDRVSGAHGE